MTENRNRRPTPPLHEASTTTPPYISLPSFPKQPGRRHAAGFTRTTPPFKRKKARARLPRWNFVDFITGYKARRLRKNKPAPTHPY